MTNSAKTYPPVVVVDNEDNVTGSAMLAEVWQKGLYHRIVTIFVSDELGRMLLQLRAPNMQLYPNCWDQAAGGHVDEGLSYEQAALIEVAEELGLQSATLIEVDTYRFNNQYEDRVMNQFVRVYSLQVPHDIGLVPQLDEVSKLQWFTRDELKLRIAHSPELFTPGLLFDLKKYFPAYSH